MTWRVEATDWIRIYRLAGRGVAGSAHVTFRTLTASGNHHRALDASSSPAATLATATSPSAHSARRSGGNAPGRRP